MALIGNYSVYDKLPLKYCTGPGAAASGQFGARGNYSQSGRVRSRMMQDQATTALTFYALPNGSYPTLSFFIPQKAGQIGSSNQIFGSGASTGNLAGGKNAVASISGAGSLSATIAGLAALNAALTGAGSLSGTIVALGALLSSLSGAGSLSASILAAGPITADLSGSGSATLTLVGAANLVASLSGAGTISNANLTLLARILADLIGSGLVTAVPNAQGSLAAAIAGAGNTSATVTANGALLANVNGVGTLSLTPYAVGDMGANITGQSDLSPQSLAAAVWSALAAQYNVNGTMGQKLNSAAAGGIDYATLAAAVIAAMNATPPDVNIAKINGLGVDGAGTEANPWGPV